MCGIAVAVAGRTAGGAQRLPPRLDPNGDELLQRSGNRYHLTALAGVERVFDVVPDFDPARAEREFTALTSDYAALILGRTFSDLVAERAPHVRLRFEQNVPQVVERIDEALRTVDGIVMPRGFLDDLPSTDLCTDESVCLVSGNNDRVGDGSRSASTRCRQAGP